MPDTTGPLTSALDQIKARGYHNGARGALCARLSDAAAVDVSLLLAAVEAVLAKADEWEAADPGHPCAAMIREAVAAELTKGSPDHG